MGANAATKAFKVAENLERILAIEFYNAAQAMDFRRPAKTSPYLEEILSNYRNYVKFLEEDEVMYHDINETCRFLRELTIDEQL